MDFGILKISEFVPYYLGISILFLHKGSGRTKFFLLALLPTGNLA